MVGQSLRYEIGTVTYKSNEGETSPNEEGASNTVAIVGSVTSVLVVLSGAIIITKLWLPIFMPTKRWLRQKCSSSYSIVYYYILMYARLYLVRMCSRVYKCDVVY